MSQSQFWMDFVGFFLEIICLKGIHLLKEKNGIIK
jgi:hypothetical protein